MASKIVRKGSLQKVYAAYMAAFVDFDDPCRLQHLVTFLSSYVELNRASLTLQQVFVLHEAITRLTFLKFVLKAYFWHQRTVT